MATIELFVTGDEIGTYSGYSMSGNSNGVKLTLSGVDPLGAPDEVFRVVITQANGADAFQNGQFVSVYAYPDDGSGPLFEQLNPQHDQFQGRASSSEHQIFTSPDNIVIDINGLTEGTMQYGPGLYPLRSEKLPFSNLSDDPPSLPCFTAGTRIATPGGPRAIEDLRVGDRVSTADHGDQIIRWIGARQVAGIGAFAPIRFEAGAIGNLRPLRVSPQHRLLISGWHAEMLFGQSEVLVAAKHLVNETTIRPDPTRTVTYLHMIFDRHEIVFAEGVPTESLHLGTVAMGALDCAARDEVLSLFPELDRGTGPATARRCLTGWEGRLIA